MSFQQPCLPVSKKRRKKFEDGSGGGSGEEDVLSFEAVEHMDATEYLSRVSHQASALPETFVSSSSSRNDLKDVDDGGSHHRPRHRPRSKYVPPIDGLGASMSYLISDRTLIRPPPSAEHLPKVDPQRWVDQTLETFSRLRDYLDTCSENGVGGKGANRLPVPPMKDRPNWHIFCVGMDGARGNEGSYFQDDGNDEEEFQQREGKEGDMDEDQQLPIEEPGWKKNLPENGHSPDVSLLLQFDQVLVRRVLSHLAYYVESGWCPANEQRSAWIYALLARLERPIHRDDASVMHGLLKALCRYRSEMVFSTPGKDGVRSSNGGGGGAADSDDRTRLARVNVLIAIIGIYFEQGGGFSAVMTAK